MAEVDELQAIVPPEKTDRLVGGPGRTIARQVAIDDGHAVDGREDVVLEGVSFSLGKVVMLFGILSDDSEKIGRDASSPFGVQRHTDNASRPWPRLVFDKAGHVNISGWIRLPDHDAARDFLSVSRRLSTNRQGQGVE